MQNAAEPSRVPDLSIIIVNYETPEYTLQCLRSLREHAPHCPHEIIVIDNGSRDSSLEAIRSAYPEVKLIETGENAGFSRANNLGVHNSRGRYILFLNSDTQILNGAVQKMVNILGESPSVGIVAPKQVDGEGKLQLSWGAFPTLSSEIVRKVFHHRLSLNDARIRDYLEERYSGLSEVDWVSGSCFMVRRQALTEAGLFDRNFFMYFEDIDLCRRVKDRGWQIQYNAELGIIHYGGVSASKNILKVLLEYRRSQLYFTRKYYGLGGVLLLKAILLAKYGTHFFKWGAAFAGARLLRLDDKSAYAKLLLTKKTTELIFGVRPKGVGLDK